MRKELAVALTLIAASLVALVLFLRSTSEPRRGESDAGSRSTVAAADDGSRDPLAEPAGDGAGAQFAQFDRQAAAVPTPSSPSPSAEKLAASASAGDATLVVRCLGMPAGRLLEGIRVSVWKQERESSTEAENVEDTHGSLTKMPITGKSGEVELELPSGVGLYVFARAEHDDAGFVDRELPALAKGERRVLILELAAGEDLRFNGIVLAHETRAPIAGAHILVLRSVGTQFSALDHEEEMLDELAEATTDKDGRFALSTSSWKNPFLRVDADGFGPVLFSPGTNHSTPEEARVILLDRSATIEATVVDTSGAPIAGVTVEIVANGYELQPKDGAWEYDSASVAHVRWVEKTGGDGRCTLKDLAANVPLNVVLMRDAEVVQREGQTVTLTAGEVRALQWTMGSGCALTGRLVDQDKKPVARRELWLVRAYADEAHYFNIYEAYELKTTAVTDDAGRFSLASVSPGMWWIGPSPEPNAGTPDLTDELAAYAKRIDIVPGTREMTVEVEVQRGLYIRGRVLDSAGAGAPNASVTAGMDGHRWGMSGQAKADGTFAVGPLMPGKFEMYAHGNGTDADSSTVDARAGDDNVVLKLHLGGSIEGRVVDASGAGVRAGISISAQHVARFDLQLMATQNDGSFKWEGLEPGAYDLIARLNDGRVAVARAVSLGAGAKVNGLVLTMEPGAKLRLSYTGSGASPWFKVRSEGAVVLSDPFEKDKASVVVVPKGKVSIEVRVDGDEKVERRELEVAAGDDKEIVFAGAR